MTNKVAIVLVEPQKGENIGFVARAMLNFGLTDLRLVSPRDGWPNADAEATAVKALPILKSAKVFNSFSEAIADLNYVYVTTARDRSMNKRVISSTDLSNDIKNRFASGISKIGMVFGPERSGVDNDVIALSNQIVCIPSGSDFPSLNLGMATGVICYEVLKSLSNNPDDVKKDDGLASHDDVKNLLFRLDKMLQDSGFYQVEEKRAAMLQNLSSVVTRIDLLTKKEVSTLMGIFRSLYDYKK